MTSKPDKEPFDRSGFRPARGEPTHLERKRMAQTEFVVSPDDGAVTIVDHAEIPFQPTEEQELFLERRFWDWDYSYSVQKALAAAGCTKGDWRHWMRDPGFHALYMEQKKERGALILDNAQELTVRALEHGYEPSKDEKWAVDLIIKNQREDEKMNLRFVQINQQFNIGGVSMDMDDEQLQKVIDGAGATATNTVKAALES